MPAAGTDRCITAPRMAEVFLRSFTTAFGRSCRGQLSIRKGEMRVSGLLIVLYSEQKGHSFCRHMAANLPLAAAGR